MPARGDVGLVAALQLAVYLRVEIRAWLHMASSVEFMARRLIHVWQVVSQGMLLLSAMRQLQVTCLQHDLLASFVSIGDCKLTSGLC